MPTDQPEQPDQRDHFHAPQKDPAEAGKGAARERFHAREIAQVLSHYDIGVIREIREYRRGSRRAAKLKLVAERGEYLLKRRAAGRVYDAERARAAASHRLQQLAAKGGVPVASLVALRSGGSLLQFDGRLYELFQWVPGARYQRHAEQARAAGIALSRMHGAFAGIELLEDLPLGGFSEFEPVRAMMEQAKDRALARANADERQSIEASVELLLSYLHLVESKLNAKGLPLQRTAICHGDFHPGNTLWFGDTLGAVIDFDSARHEAVAAEIANASLQFAVRQRLGEDPDAWPTGLDPDNLRAFLAGYAAAPAIELREIASMVPWLMMSAIVAEAASPIARDGDFAGIPPAPFLRATAGLVDWIAQRTRAVTSLVEEVAR